MASVSPSFFPAFPLVHGVPARSRSLPGPASPQNRERLSIMKDTYAILIYWSDDDEAFIATVPELPGCMAHGETRALAIEQIEIAIENWADTAREIGREIPEPVLDWAAQEKEIDQRARETLKAGIENAMPEITEALAKEMAKSGSTDVWLRYSRGGGIEGASYYWQVKTAAHEKRLAPLNMERLAERFRAKDNELSDTFLAWARLLERIKKGELHLIESFGDALKAAPKK